MNNPVRKKIVFKKKMGTVNFKPKSAEGEEDDLPPTEVLSAPEQEDAVPPMAQEETPAAEPKKPEPPPPPPQTKSVEEADAAPVLFKFYCVYCGQKLSSKAGMAGRKISCPACGHRIEIPEDPSKAA